MNNYTNLTTMTIAAKVKYKIWRTPGNLGPNEARKTFILSWSCS